MKNLKYLYSICLGIAIAFLQLIPSKSESAFDAGFILTASHFVMIFIICILAGTFVGYKNLASTRSETENDYFDDFTFVFSAAAGIGILGVIRFGDSIITSITPYFGFGLCLGLVLGKIYFSRIGRKT